MSDQNIISKNYFMLGNLGQQNKRTKAINIHDKGKRTVSYKKNDIRKKRIIIEHNLDKTEYKFQRGYSQCSPVNC